MKYIVIFLVLIGFVALTQQSFAWCMENEDWKDAPCYGAAYQNFSKEKIQDDWASYYDYKGQDWMEQKKVELMIAIRDRYHEEWHNESDANSNVFQYYYAFYDMDKYQNFYSPHKQLTEGFPFNEVQCKQNLVLLQKYDGSPACVTESTKMKLIERGWTDTSNFQIRTPVSMPVPSDPMSITINGSHTSLIIPIKTGETKEIDILLEPKIPIMSSIVNVESYFGSAGECKDIDIDTYCPGRGIDMFLSDTSITSQKEITLTISISDNMTGGTYAYKIETETIFESPDSGELRTVGNSIRFDLNVE